MTIDGYPVYEVDCMFEEGIYVCVFYYLYFLGYINEYIAVTIEGREIPQPGGVGGYHDFVLSVESL